MSYQPNIAIHPGRTIARSLDVLGMTQKVFAFRCGFSEKHVSQLINGEASITAETALLLENVLGGSAAFWLNLDGNYKTTLARNERLTLAQNERHMVKEFPYRELVNFGATIGYQFVDDTQKPADRVLSLWRFFGVNSLMDAPKTQPVAYRKTSSDSIRETCLAAWLRCGELMSQKQEIKRYSQSQLRKSLGEIKELSLMRGNFHAELQRTLNNNGVGFVVVPHFQHTQVSGATRWLGDNPVIQLSIRGKDADRFWFSLFHEIGHVIKHGKKESYIDFVNGEKTLVEQEVDDFAKDALIEASRFKKFSERGDFTEKAVRSFAENEMIDPGIVVGRLKHEKLIEYHQLSSLHKQLIYK